MNTNYRWRINMSKNDSDDGHIYANEGPHCKHPQDCDYPDCGARPRDGSKGCYSDSLIQLIEAERYDASGNPHYERFNDGLNYAIAIIREHIAAPDVMKVGKAIDECIKYGDCSTENLGKAAIAAMGAVGAAPASLTAEELPLDRGVSPASANSSEISDNEELRIKHEIATHLNLNFQKPNMYFNACKIFDIVRPYLIDKDEYQRLCKIDWCVKKQGIDVTAKKPVSVYVDAIFNYGKAYGILQDKLEHCIDEHQRADYRNRMQHFYDQYKAEQMKHGE